MITSMSVPKFVSPNQEGFRERYRCWDPKDFQNPGENCGSGSEQPGQGALCGRYQSEVCYETERKDCDHSSCDMECIWSDWGEWGACTPECRDGYRIRNWWEIQLSFLQIILQWDLSHLGQPTFERFLFTLLLTLKFVHFGHESIVWLRIPRLKWNSTQNHNFYKFIQFSSYQKT